MNNLDIYNKVRAVPPEAKKEIRGGRLNGKTDINPMWRIKTLTENFGVCGFGWRYEMTDKRLEKGGNGEISAFVDINLYINIDGKWSEGIVGTGGSSFVANEKNGAYTSDECFKMALTDAISVACKAIGVGADVYWDKDSTKYNKKPTFPPKQEINKETMDKVNELEIDLRKTARHNNVEVGELTEEQVQNAIEMKLEYLKNEGKEKQKEVANES